jgi:hypothetical protein
MAAACCNVCRTCTTANLVGIAFAGITGVGVPVAAFARRVLTPS